MGRSTRDASKTVSSSRRLSDVSVPKMRKLVHKVMTKHHDDKFYQKIDLIKKVLRKLKVHPVGCSETSKIRNMINRWICTNKPDDNVDKKDVKTGIPKITEEKQNSEQQRVTVDETTKELVQINSSEVLPIVVTDVLSKDVPIAVPLLSTNRDEQLTETVDKSSKESMRISSEVPIVVPSTEVQISTTEQISASVEALTNPSEIKKEKIIPLIDLTILDADEIKKEPVENDENSNAALENQVENAVMPGYNYDYYYGYPYNPYNPYNYNYNYNYYWYQAYNNSYNYDHEYNTNTNNWNGVYSSPPVSYTNNNQHT